MAPPHSTDGGTEPPAPGAIDVAAALTLLDGNHTLFEQVARSFLEEIRTLPTRLAPQLHAADLSEAARTLHTTKGLALTVGAVHLGAACREGESEIRALVGVKDGMDPQSLQRISRLISDAVTVTAGAMESALQALEAAAAQPASTQDNADIFYSSADLLGELRHLESLLVQREIRALDAYKQIRRVYGAAARGRLDALDAAMYAFDFERGVVQCNELIRELGAHNQK